MRHTVCVPEPWRRRGNDSSVRTLTYSDSNLTDIWDLIFMMVVRNGHRTHLHFTKPFKKLSWKSLSNLKMRSLIYNDVLYDFFYFLPSQSLGVVSKDVAVSILKCKDQVKRTLSSSLATVFPWSSSAAITSQPVSSWCLFFLSPRAVVAMEKVKTVMASELGCLETNELSLSLFPPSLVWIL